MDERVKDVQIWLNERYPQYFRYDPEGGTSGSYPVRPDGMTGNTTVKALIMVLQINLGLNPDGIWGGGTTNACPVISTSTLNVDLVKVVQGGFYCKGYNPGPFDGIYGSSCAGATNELMQDLGLTASNGVLAPLCFKFLLTTEPSKPVGYPEIRKVQQFLNREYGNVFLNSLGYIGTGGFFDRLTARALIFAFQKAMGTTPDGVPGTNTFNMMPTISKGNAPDKYVKILRAMLICNGYSDRMEFQGTYDDGLSNIVAYYQKFMKLDIDPTVELGKVNRRTWGALMWSRGDTARKPNACDCSKRITDSAVAQELYTRGYRYIGRYLSNRPGSSLDKRMSSEEIAVLHGAQLRIFPIFQETPASVQASFYTEENGVYAAKRATESAYDYGIPFDTTIYFAIDCDMTDGDIVNYAIPYMTALQNEMDNLRLYNVGIYAPRNVCEKLKGNFLIENCFVSNMSWGFSANLGYKMPEEWAFEQFCEEKNVNIAGMTLDLDRNMASGVDTGFSYCIQSMLYNHYVPSYIPTETDMQDPEEEIINIKQLVPYIKDLEDAYYEMENIVNPTEEQRLECTLAVCDFLYQHKYKSNIWRFISEVNDEFVLFYGFKDTGLLAKYIYAKEEGIFDKRFIRPKLLRDDGIGLFELPHLAVVIKCYLKSAAPGDWSAWAGDFAKAVEEVYNICGTNTDAYVTEECGRFGASEPIVSTIHDTRMYNYYDLNANADGYKISEMIKDEKLSLSAAILNYYSNPEFYGKRYKFYKECIGFQNWDFFTITKRLIYYCRVEQSSLLFFLANEASSVAHTLHAAAAVFAMNLLYWKEEQGIIS